ncbi:orotidine-5'-phosphate decarboxylase [Saccharophagus sp. K07]|jgi:orotidine-5'-phosphate decarboxylase|uniref:orotidine-5'-phosphate decarboxylase n=1 Tax=Saccharophagus sp. K07 TaxID=2283636 RepID=UPI001652660D|nr:orotidine-5'-phosphate decarboxylase [Saccharophagus sp. K07]MBC6907461.1 orotidine-5'-phosphate decarboxylase [Saccharophagus sp. K07]
MGSPSQTNPKQIVVALDFDSISPCEQLLNRLDPSLCRVKIGKELFTSAGPKVVELAQAHGFDVFLDLKFHDIPVTVAKAVKAAANLGVWMVNVHASGGRRMLDAAVEAIANVQNRPILIGVTVLTSMEQSELEQIGVAGPLDQQVVRLAKLVRDSGLDGVVCSAQEARQLKTNFGSDFVLVTPGIRLPGAAADDQRRIVTPADAVSLGSDYLVIGRPITQAADPVAVCRQIAESLSA